MVLFLREAMRAIASLGCEGVMRAIASSMSLLAPHTSGPRDVPRCGALSLLQKDAALQGGIQQKPLLAERKIVDFGDCVVRGAWDFTAYSR